MTEPDRDPLDTAIDRVAARLVSVEHDEVMVDRIITRLPERPGRRAWFAPLVPQAALAVCVAIVAFAWTTRDGGDVVREPRQLAPVARIEPEAPRVVVSSPAADATARPLDKPKGLSPRLVLNGLAAPRDHERSLVPVAAPVSLEVAALEAPALLDEAPVVVAPIVLTALPLSGESPSPR